MSQGIFDPSPAFHLGGPLISEQCEVPLRTDKHPCLAAQARALLYRSPIVIIHVKPIAQELDIRFLIFPSKCQLNSLGTHWVTHLMVAWHEQRFYTGTPKAYVDPHKVRWIGLGAKHLDQVLHDIRRIALNRSMYFIPRIPLHVVTPHHPNNGGAA